MAVLLIHPSWFIRNIQKIQEISLSLDIRTFDKYVNYMTLFLTNIRQYINFIFKGENNVEGISKRNQGAKI